MEKDLPRSLRIQIQFASLRLQLDRTTSKLLVRLAWCLELHIVNFPVLTLMADKPIFFLPIIAQQLLLIWKPDLVSKAKAKKSPNPPKSTKSLLWTDDRMKTFWLWMALTLVFHRHSSPLATVHLNRLIWKAYESRRVFWGHLFICKFVLTTDAGAAFSLRIFFSILRFFNLASRAVGPLVRLGVFDLVDRIWLKKYSFVRLLEFLALLALKIIEHHLYAFLFSYLVNWIFILVRGSPLFGYLKLGGSGSYQISGYTIIQYLLDERTRSRRLWTKNQENVTSSVPLQPFKYSSIEEENAIRLLLIHPRHPDSSVECSLFQVPLSSVPHYEALSYRWGGTGPDQEIYVNGLPITVTPNALEVIKNRSSFWQPKLVWIDSVCIDQTNEHEKAQQIELMAEIYRKAYIVTAAILVAPEGLDINSELRRLIGDWAAETWSDWGKNPNLFKFQNELVKHLMASFAADVLDELHLSFFRHKSNQFSWYQEYAPQRYTFRIKAFRQFIKNPWFERMWVVQEVALPPSLRVLYGDLEIDWKHLVEALYLISENSILSGPLLESGDSAGLRVPPPAAGGTLPLMARLRQWVQEDKDRPLGELLLHCRQFMATEPKDKLFAIRGMCSVLPEHLLKPTESIGKTWEEVFLNAAEVLVSQGDTSKMLAASGCLTEEDARSSSGLPSWVPNWTTRQAGSSLSFFDESMDYKAGGPEPTSARVELQSLFLDGIMFDEIIELGPVWDISPSLAGPRHATDFIFDSPELLKASYDKVIWSRWTKEPYIGFDNQRLREAFWRTLIGNRSLKENPSPSSLAKGFETYEKFMVEIIKNPDRVRNNVPVGLKEQEELSSMSCFSHPTMRCWAGRRVCITMKGYIGVVPPRSELGDKIVVFVGMQTPSVIRTVKGNAKTNYEHIGECYVHGLMDGEIFKTGSPRREFELV